MNPPPFSHSFFILEAIEFQASVKDGVIRVPAAYRERLTRPVRVILLTESEPEREDLINQLLLKPRKAKGFRPLSRDAAHE